MFSCPLLCLCQFFCVLTASGCLKTPHLLVLFGIVMRQHSNSTRNICSKLLLLCLPNRMSIMAKLFWAKLLRKKLWKRVKTYYKNCMCLSIEQYFFRYSNNNAKLSSCRTFWALKTSFSFNPFFFFSLSCWLPSFFLSTVPGESFILYQTISDFYVLFHFLIAFFCDFCIFFLHFFTLTYVKRKQENFYLGM